MRAGWPTICCHTKPYTCISNDLVLPINILREINYRHQTYIIGANINYRQAISCNVSIIVICINLSIILQAILYETV